MNALMYDMKSVFKLHHVVKDRLMAIYKLCGVIMHN